MTNNDSAIPVILAKGLLGIILIASGGIGGSYIAEKRIEKRAQDTPGLFAPDRYTATDADRDRSYFEKLINRNNALITELHKDIRSLRTDVLKEHSHKNN